MKHKKKLLAVIVFAAVVTWSGVFYVQKKPVKANHDYVCGRSAVSCNNTCTWGAWDTDTNTRICKSRQALITMWGNTRVRCAYQNSAFGNYGGFRGGMQYTDLTTNTPGVRNYNNEPVVDPSKPEVVVGYKMDAYGQQTPIYGPDTTILNGYYYKRSNGECAGAKGEPLANPPLSCYIKVVPEADCIVREETDIVEPVCNFQRVNNGTQLQFKCTKGVGGKTNCVDYKSWTNVDFAQPNEVKIIGIATEAGIYKGCVVETE